VPKKTPKKTTRPPLDLKPDPKQFSRMGIILDRLADQHAIWPRDLRRRPELLEKYGLEPEDVTDQLVCEAGLIHHNMMKAIADRYGATLG
jgi:hypothetical protein